MTFEYTDYNSYTFTEINYSEDKPKVKLNRKQKRSILQKSYRKMLLEKTIKEIEI